MVTRAAKDLLRNTIRSTGYHNRLLEEEEMWKHWEVEKGLTMMVTDDYIRRRMRMDEYGGPSGIAVTPSYTDRVHCNMKELQKQKQAARESQRVGDNFWNRKLMEIEEKDPDRWGHSGYKELYPEEFKSSTSSKIAKHKNSSPDSSLCSSKKSKRQSESKKRIKRRKKHKKRHSRSISSEGPTEDVHKVGKDINERKHFLSCKQSYENSTSHARYKSKNATSNCRSSCSSGLPSPEIAEMHVQDVASESSEDSGSLYSKPFLSDVSEAELQRRKEYLKRKLEEDSSDDSSSEDSYPDSYSSKRKGSPERIHSYNENSNSNGRGPQYYRHKRKLKSHIVNIK